MLHQRHKHVNDILREVFSLNENDSGFRVAFWALLGGTARDVLVLLYQTHLAGNMRAGREIEVDWILGILTKWMVRCFASVRFG